MIDLVLFNDELDLLVTRIQYLSDFVDTFVIIEAKQTFSGKTKALIAQENRILLRDASSKPIVLLEADFSKVAVKNAWDFEKETRKQLIDVSCNKILSYPTNDLW
jgi:beta-1,4-mannosyl-glycoprotein beta-1,4-N-acetylglucosaminyltransferase